MSSSSASGKDIVLKPVLQEIFNVAGSLAEVFGIKTSKWFGDEGDITKLLTTIRDNLTGPINLGMNALSKAENKMQSLLMLPLSGQMKRVVMQARSALKEKTDQIRNRINIGDAAATVANTLADDLAGASFGDRLFGKTKAKRENFDNRIFQARKAYEEAAELGKDI